FSEFGFSTLVERAQDDGDLALAVWVRPEIPRQHLLALFAQASEAVRQTLEAADRAKGGLLQEVIAQASSRLQTGLREVSAVYATARERVVALHRDGELDEARLAEVARPRPVARATIPPSLLADPPHRMTH